MKGASLKFDTAEIEKILKDGAASGDVPGVAAALTTRDGPVFEGAYGVRDPATGAPMRTDSIIWIASLTKAITGACAMQLVEQGKLALDEPIDKLVADLGKVQVIDSIAPGGAVTLRPPKRPMTLRDLLTHTSGFAYHFWNEDMRRYMEIADPPGGAVNAPLMFDPGERWEYGVGLDWVGKVIEAASGKRLGQYMRENLFDPLDMPDSGFTLTPSQHERIAKVHQRTPDGLIPIAAERSKQPEFESGGGGLYSTVRDYLNFTQMILRDGEYKGRRLLTADTVALMGQNAIGALEVQPLKTAMPASSNDVDVIKGMKWGLTFLINPLPLATGRPAGSLAWAGLANCYYWIDKKNGIAGVFATQILPFYDAKAVRIFEDFEAATYRSLN
jgi:methyl acetate hydrolase